MSSSPSPLAGLARLCAAVVLALVPFSTALAQSPTDQPVVARVTIANPSELQRFVALGLDLLETREGDDLFIVTTRDEVDRLRADGWTIRADPERTSQLQQQQQEQRQRSAPRLQPRLFQGGYRTVPEIRAALDDAAAQYPGLAEVFVYGSSWERLTGGPTAGHDLSGITLTNRARTGPKPTFLLMAAIHARELATPELALRFVDYLLARYGIDADATWLLDEHRIVVIPVVNPDGHVLAEQGYLQRKNTDTSHGTCSVPNIGVDLNRNAEFKWGVVNTPAQSPCSETYPGPVPVSEPETAALEALIRSLFPDQRGPNDTDAAPLTATGTFITLHSYADLVLWPWGYTRTPAPNAAQLSQIGRKLASYNGLTPQQSIELYPTSGTTDDWAYGELGIAAFTFEVGPNAGSCAGFFPPFSCLDGGTGGAFWPRNLPAFLYAARIARAPFALGQGPTTEAVTATLLPDGRLELEARLEEPPDAAQPVAAAEYYVDTPPWSGGTAVPMAPSDGGFDQTVEVATATLEPLAGRRLIFVRAQDGSGTWGPVHAAFSPDPACPAALSPTGQPITSAGGGGSVAIAIPDGCPWSSDTVETWITVAPGTGGVGSGLASYTVAPNPGATPRTGTIAIAGQMFTITQDAQTPPDLLITQLTNPPTAAAPGTAFSISVTAGNGGGATAPASTVRFYLSADVSRSAGDPLLAGTRGVPALAAGASSTGFATVKIPSATALGVYHFLACADDTGVVAEGDEQNNCMAAPGTIRVTRPDLIETAVSVAPAAAAPGARVSVTDTAINQGAVASSASTTRYYLSADAQRGGADTLLTGTRGVPSLAASASSRGTVSVAIPAGTPLGLYHVLACADDLRAVIETDESNNCAASDGTLQVTRANLVATDVGNPPSALAPGGVFKITDTVQNQGGVAASASTVRYYLSADGQKGGGDIRLIGARSVAALAAGASSAGAGRTVTVPSSTPLGTYHVLACADDLGAVPETNEADNCRASIALLQVARPNLVETAVSSPPATIRAGLTFTIADTVQNQGVVDAKASTTRYYLSLDGSKGGGDVLLGGKRPVPALAAGAFSQGALVTVTVPASTPRATYYVLACADDTSVVVETDEANCRASSSQVTVTP